MENAKKAQIISERVYGTRTARGWSQAQLARNSKVSLRTVQNYESGNFKKPQGAKLRKIADAVGESFAYMMGKELGERPNVRVELATHAPVRKIPVVSWATAGAGGNFHDCAEQIEEYLDSDTKDANAYALIIEGDSMVPDYKPGDRVIFEPNRAAQNGDIVVARLLENGHVFFKLFHVAGARSDLVRLTSFNPAYPALEFPAKAFRFIHPMHSMIRRHRR